MQHYAYFCRLIQGMDVKTFSIGIIGASGYTGAELLRLLLSHPSFSVHVATAHSESGKRVTDLYPHLVEYSNLVLGSFEEQHNELNSCDVVFSALPHGALMTQVQGISTKIIDLSSDFRLKKSADYIRWYKKEHTAPEALAEWEYGLPEIFRKSIQSTTRIANPGCFATAATLALAPAVKANLVEGDIVIDAISGTSGAGKSPNALLHFSHEHENIVAYKVGEHQHIGEIEQSLNSLSQKQHLVSMTTQLAPMSRGIHAICSVKARQGITTQEVIDCYYEHYKNEPFVKVCNSSPHTKYVRGANTIMLYPFLDQRTSRVIVTSVIDNLMKGAAGQAIQNANILCGLDETVGLPLAGLYP
jgi:N-acetyl-gamma-glutamyl-phosphate reductase